MADVAHVSSRAMNERAGLTRAEERDILDTIRHWQNRGVTVNMVWEALGHRPSRNATWTAVRAHMTRWLLREAE